LLYKRAILCLHKIKAKVVCVTTIILLLLLLLCTCTQRGPWPSECFRVEQMTVNCVWQLSETHHNLIRSIWYYTSSCSPAGRFVQCERARVCVFFVLSLSLKITQVRLLIARQNTCNFTFSGRFVGDKITTTTGYLRGL